MALAAFVGFVAGAVVVARMSRPTLEGCCLDLADAAADKVADILGGEKAAESIRRVLDATGVTEMLPRLIALSKGR